MEKIDIQNKLFHSRNETLKGLRYFILNCLSHMKFKNYSIDFLKFYINNRNKKPIKGIGVEIYGIKPDQFLGADWEEKVEKAGLGINLALIDLIDDYNMVIQNSRKNGADLLLIKNNSKVIFLESKGCTQEKCDGPISEGYSQVKKSFKKYTGYNILYGLVGCAAFSNKIHFFIKLKNLQEIIIDSKMDEVEINKSRVISELISEAIKEEAEKNQKKSEILYEKAAKKQYELALSLLEKGSLRGIPNLISAGYSALKTENYELTSHIILKLDELVLNDVQKSEFRTILTEFEMLLKYDKDYHIQNPLKTNIIKMIIFQYDIEQDIRGIGHIEKIVYAIKKELIKTKLYLPYQPIAVEAPIVIPEVKKFIDQSIEMGYFKKKKNYYTISTNGKEMWKSSINEAELFFKKNVPARIQQKIKDMIFKLGKMKSRELKKWERETYFITKKSYMRKID